MIQDTTTEKISLKKQLHRLLQSYEGQEVPYNRIMRIVDRMEYKRRTAERILNKSLSPDVETLYNEKGYIKGYRWKGIVEIKNPISNHFQKVLF